MQRISLVPGVLLAMLAGCGVGGALPSTASPAATAGEVVGEWVLAGGSIDGEPAPVLEDHRITLSITGSQISGSAACNSYGGEITVAGDGIHLEGLGQTEMACDEPAMAAEAAFMGALQRVRQIVREGETLVARGEGVELEFAALAPPPTAEMVGTAWVLDTVLVGDVASSPVGEPATLELAADGTFSGSTGCRTFSGEWLERGDQILAPSWGMDQTACLVAVSSQDSHVTSVIGDGFVPTIDGDLLTLMDPGGMGLVYRSGQ